MQQVKIGNKRVPQIGMGTWFMGEGSAQKTKDEVASLRYGLDHGLTVIDTAEMYGEGAAERVVGQAIQGYNRENIFLISKFYPWHATDSLIRKSLKASLRRLGTDYLDLYLLHWRGNTPLTETISTLRSLQNEGLIRAYGVSNFDTLDLAEARAVSGGRGVVANEVLYNVAARGIEYDLVPAQQQAGVALISYSPYGSGDGHAIRVPHALQKLADSKGITAHQLLLAWVLRTGNVLSIPKASRKEHMAANIAAGDVELTADDLRLIDKYFPAPTHKVPLAEI
jgi:diketogulonate reductase-like aldo/keto reductase